ncbi:UPF0175 family protein [Candidatus Woesearchaeota archaeon]|nr:UPF0175 family protein [Candidatus Woesearchaeota archaeon]
MATTISVRLDKSVLKELAEVEDRWQTDRSEVVRRLLASSIHEFKIKTALEDVAAHKKSIGKAAEKCGVSLWEMLELTKERNVDWTGYSGEDLEKDLKLLK